MAITYGIDAIKKKIAEGKNLTVKEMELLSELDPSAATRYMNTLMKKESRMAKKNMDYNKGEKAMKTCPGCPTPAKCKAAGKCLKSAGMYGGGMAKKKGYNKGGYAKCGASNPPAKKR